MPANQTCDRLSRGLAWWFWASLKINSSSPQPRHRAARTSDDREILRTTMELLNQLNGFYELSKSSIKPDIQVSCLLQIVGRLKVESNSELKVAPVQWWLRWSTWR